MVDKVQCKEDFVKVVAEEQEQEVVVGVFVQHAEQLYHIEGVFPVSKWPVLNAAQK